MDRRYQCASHLPQVPLTADGNTEINYYKIPVRDPKATGEDAKKLNRNTIYTIEANINNKGGSSEIGYITTGKVVYDVLPWSDGGTTDIDANTSYLMVTPKVVYMKNVDEDMSVTYKSSSPVTIVSKRCTTLIMKEKLKNIFRDM